MKIRLAVLVIAVGALLATTVPVIAHHSFGAEFDSDLPFEFTGVVTKIEWLNPHVYFYMDVTEEGGAEVTNWAMEMGSPNGLMRRGWTRNSLKIGDVVSTMGSKARDGSEKGNARTVTLESGRQLFAGSSEDTNN